MMRVNEEQVLEYVNGLREKHGIGGPLAEVPADATLEEVLGADITCVCPIAKALGSRCSLSVASLNGSGEELPDYVREFIVDHDRRFFAMVEAF